MEIDGTLENVRAKVKSVDRFRKNVDRKRNIINKVFNQFDRMVDRM